MATLSEALSAAFDHHAAGRLREAEILYRRILIARPNHPDARHLLGLALAQGGRADEGLEQVDAAITANPNSPAYHFSQGKLRDALGRPGAEDSYPRRPGPTARSAGSSRAPRNPVASAGGSGV